MKRVIGKKELVARAASKAGVSKKAIETALNALMDSTQEIVAEGDTLQLIGFGKFYPAIKKGRSGTIPGTERSYNTQDTIIPKFDAGQAFKKSL